VPATLSLSVGNASFGAFVPGVAREYEAKTTANVISTAGDAALTVSGSYSKTLTFTLSTTMPWLLAQERRQPGDLQQALDGG